MLGTAQRGIIRVHSDSFDTVTVSPDGSRIIASLSGKGLIGVWDASGSRIVLADWTDEKSAHCVRFFANGPRAGLAGAVTWDGRVIVIDDALQVVSEVQGTDSHFGRVAVSPDGHTIATGDWEGVVSLWDVDTMLLRWRWQAHPHAIKALEFSPCGQYLASGGNGHTPENSVRVWGLGGAAPARLAEARARHWVESVCFSGDSKLLYWGDYEGAVERWAWNAGGARSLVRDEHDSPASVVVLFGEHHLLCGVGGAFDPVPVEVWNLEEGRIEQNLHGHLFSVGDIALIPGTQRVVSAGDSTLRLWDLGTAVETQLTAVEPEVSWVAFREPQGWVITAAETSKTVWVRTLADGTLLLKLDGNAEAVSGIALSGDGRMLACGVSDGSVHLWDLDSGEARWETRHHKRGVNALAFSPDDGLLATGGEDGRVNLIAVEDGAIVKQGRVHRGDYVHSLAFSHDGSLVASGGYSTLQVWNRNSLEVLLKLKDVTHYALWFAPDDTILIAEGMSQFGMAWNLATGQPVPDGPQLRALYDGAVLRAGARWRWSSPGNIGWQQEYLRLIDTQTGAAVAAFPELQGAVQWHPGGRIWVNKRSRQISLLRLEAE
jgi:WD40 repeat protein